VTTTTTEPNGHPGRPTTYVQELYRLREAGALDPLSAPAVDVATRICHLADVFGRDAVFQKQRELAATLRRDERRVRAAIADLDGFLCAGEPNDPWEGRDLVYVDAHRAKPEQGYRRATMFTLGPAFPDAARWGYLR
jgi:hypothetical protein